MITKVETSNWRKTLIQSALMCDYYKDSWKDIDLVKLIFSEDISKLPFLDRQEVRKNPLSFLIHGVNKQELIAESTSGSTGIPLTCYRTKSEQSQLGLVLHGARLRNNINISYLRMIEFGPFDLPAIYEKRGNTTVLLLSALYMDEAILEFYWKKMIEFNPTFIQGFPSVLSSMASYAKKQSLDTSLPELTYLETRSEVLLPSQHKIIKSVFKTKVFSFYGSREFWAIAYSCANNKLHLIEESCFLEIIDDSGRPTVKDEFGKIAVTGKVGMTMPLVRYLIGDMGRLIDCNCDLNSRCIEVIGRVNENIVVPGGEKSSSVLTKIMVILMDIQSIIQIQFIQELYDKFVIRFTGDTELPENLSEICQEILSDYLMCPVKVQFENVEAILPDTISGKVKSFISLVRRE